MHIPVLSSHYRKSIGIVIFFKSTLIPKNGTDNIHSLQTALASLVIQSHPSVHLYPLQLFNRLTFDPDLLHVSRGVKARRGVKVFG